MGKSIKAYSDTYCTNGGTGVKPGVLQLFASSPYLEFTVPDSWTREKREQRTRAEDWLISHCSLWSQNILVILRDFCKSWLGMDFALKQLGDLNALLLQLSCGLCDTLNHLSFYCSDHSLSKYAITTTLLIVVFTFVKKNKLGPGSLITKPSVNLWPQCWSKNTVSMMTMSAKPFWLIISEIPPSLHQRTTP